MEKWKAAAPLPQSETTVACATCLDCGGKATAFEIVKAAAPLPHSEARWSLFDFVRAENELAELFGRRVDLVEREVVEESDNRFRKGSILNSAVLLDVA